ncbi:MAG: YbhB/YbcL family Raf kinase inhibitor-like protein [Acidimicrobiales bacterium]
MPRPPLPYEFLPEVPPLTVTSVDMVDGKELPNAHRADIMGMTGDNLSPALAWSGAPAGTQSFAVTCFDPDAPTGSGFWHWVLFDLPSSVTELPRGAGSGSMQGLPTGAIHARNDTGGLGYIGAAPPDGHGEHRYVFAVHALGIGKLGLDESATPAFVGFTLTFNTLARGLLIALFAR